jgi:hypothetical protein
MGWGELAQDATGCQILGRRRSRRDGGAGAVDGSDGRRQQTRSSRRRGGSVYERGGGRGGGSRGDGARGPDSAEELRCVVDSARRPSSHHRERCSCGAANRGPGRACSADRAFAAAAKCPARPMREPVPGEARRGRPPRRPPIGRARGPALVPCAGEGDPPGAAWARGGRPGGSSCDRGPRPGGGSRVQWRPDCRRPRPPARASGRDWPGRAATRCHGHASLEPNGVADGEVVLRFGRAGAATLAADGHRSLWTVCPCAMRARCSHRPPSIPPAIPTASPCRMEPSPDPHAVGPGGYAAPLLIPPASHEASPAVRTRRARSSRGGAQRLAAAGGWPSLAANGEDAGGGMPSPPVRARGERGTKHLPLPHLRPVPNRPSTHPPTPPWPPPSTANRPGTARSPPNPAGRAVPSVRYLLSGAPGHFHQPLARPATPPPPPPPQAELAIATRGTGHRQADAPSRPEPGLQEPTHERVRRRRADDRGVAGGGWRRWGEAREREGGVGDGGDGEVEMEERRGGDGGEGRTWRRRCDEDRWARAPGISRRWSGTVAGEDVDHGTVGAVEGGDAAGWKATALRRHVKLARPPSA